MFIVDPAKIANWSEDRLQEGYIQNRLSILHHALKNASNEPSADTMQQAIECLKDAAGITLEPAVFASILNLYPYAKAKLADYGWGDTEVREMTLDVVANAYLGSRWPTYSDNCDLNAFVERLKFAVAYRFVEFD